MLWSDLFKKEEPPLEPERSPEEVALAQQLSEMESLWADIPLEESMLLDSSLCEEPKRRKQHSTEDESSEMLLPGDQCSQDLFSSHHVEEQLLSAELAVLHATNETLQQKLSTVEKELQSSRGEVRKLKSLNNLHLENALVKATQQEKKEDSLPGSLLAMLNNLKLDETASFADETQDLSLLDVTLTTGLNNNSIFGKTVLTSHLGDIQSEAMKLKERSEELCRQNEELTATVKKLNKELEGEREKVKGKGKELKEERERIKKKDTQIKGHNAALAKKLEEQKGKLVEDKRDELKKKEAQIKSNAGLHKKSLDEMKKVKDEVKREREGLQKDNEELRKENEELKAEKESTLEQALGLAKIINTKAQCTSRETQTLYRGEEQAVCNELARAQREVEQVTDRLKQVEEHYKRQLLNNEHSIHAANRDKAKCENELYLVKQILASVTDSTRPRQSSFSFKDEGVEMSQEFRKLSDVSSTHTKNETLQYSALRDQTIDESVEQKEDLPATSYRLVGMFKTASEQVQDLSEQLAAKTTAHTELVRQNQAMQLKLDQQGVELKKFGSHMAEEDNMRDKLLDANRLISKLKGEILKLSTEVQQGHQGNNDELIEENMELKQQVENLAEVRSKLMADVQMLREQLVEEQEASDYNSQLLVDARNECNQHRNNQELAQEKLKQADKKNQELETQLKQSDKQSEDLKKQVDDLQGQLKLLQASLKKEKDRTEELMKQNSSTERSNERVAKANQAAEELDNEVDRLKRLLKKKDAEVEDAQEEITLLKNKLKKIQPSLLSLEEDNLVLNQKVRSLEQQVITLREDNSILSKSNSGLLGANNVFEADVNDSIKSRLDEARRQCTEQEARADLAEQDALRLSSELHASKEALVDCEERCAKLETKLAELQAWIDRKRTTAGTQTSNKKSDVSVSVDTVSEELTSYKDHISKLESQLQKVTDRNGEIEREMCSVKESAKETGSTHLSTIEQLEKKRTEHQEMMFKMQQDQLLALSNLRNTLTSDNDAALSSLRERLSKEHERELEALRKRLSDDASEALERAKLSLSNDHSAMMDKLVSEMETKRQQDYTLIARKACLDPATLTKVLPNSPQLNDRIEALHNQALQIRNLALQFYDASHKPTADICVQTSVRVFRQSTQTTETGLEKVEEKKEEKKVEEDVVKVLREEHAKQTELLLAELRLKQDPADKNQLKAATEEIQHLKLSVETYTTRCSILEHNARLLKDRNTGLENDLMINAGEYYLETEGVHEEYQPEYTPPAQPAYQPAQPAYQGGGPGTYQSRHSDRHAGRQQLNEGFNAQYDRPNNNDSYVQDVRHQNKVLRNRLAECQNEVAGLQSCVADYQENVERLEHELDEERGVRDKTEKLMRDTEATLIEVKNDAIFANEQQATIMKSDKANTGESIKLLETENKKLKEANSKLKDLNFSLLEANQKLKALDNNSIFNKSHDSHRSLQMIDEVDSIKLIEDLRLELNSKMGEIQSQAKQITANQDQVDSLKKQISLLKDESESKEKVVKMIKTELSTQQLDCAESRALLEIEKGKCNELERQFKVPTSLSKRYEKCEIQSLKDEISRLKSASPAQDQGPRVTKAYLKYLKAESARKALVFQKQYLMGLLANAKAVENVALSILEIKSPPVHKKKTFKHVGVLVLAFVRMRKLVAKWGKIRLSLEEKQRNKLSPSPTSRQSRQSRPSPQYNPSPQYHPTPQYNSSQQYNPSPHSRSGTRPSPERFNSSYRSYQEPPQKSPVYPKWDSSRPLSPPPQPKRKSPPPPQEVSLSRLDLQLARLRRSVQISRASDPVSPTHDSFRQSGVRENVLLADYVSNIPEKDETENADGTLCDISNYITRLEAVQSRLTDLKLSSYKIYDP